MIYSLGGFSFIDLAHANGRSGPPELPRERVEVIERPGLNGTGLLLLGAKGRPFPVRTLAGVTSRSAGLELIELYNSFVGADPLSLIWADESYTVNHGVAFQIVDVLRAEVIQIGASSAGYPFLVAAVLTLLPVTV